MRREFRFAISSSALIVLLMLALLPERVWPGMPQLCLIRNIFDVECFGCGMTRALAAALHGDPAGAVRLNAGVTLALPALLAAVLQGLWIRK